MRFKPYQYAAMYGLGDVTKVERLVLGRPRMMEAKHLTKVSSGVRVTRGKLMTQTRQLIRAKYMSRFYMWTQEHVPVMDEAQWRRLIKWKAAFMSANPTEQELTERKFARRAKKRNKHLTIANG